MDDSPSVATATLTYQDKRRQYWPRKFLSRYWRQGLSVTCVGIASLITALNIGAVHLLERQVQTLAWELRGPVTAPDDIVILAIDEESLSQGQHYLDQPDRYADLAEISTWPWRRSAYATVIQRLLDSGARAVALDIVFSTPSTYGPVDDAALAQVLAQRGSQVVLAAQYGDINIRQGVLLQPTLPLWQFQKTPVRIGAINFIVEPDGKIHRLSREFLSLLSAQQSPLPVSTPASMSFEGEDGEALPLVSFAEATLAAAQVDYTATTGDHIFFYGPAQTFTHIPFWYVLDDDPWYSQLQSGAIFKNKIVLIGSTATLHQDFHAAPFSKSVLYPSPLSGVEILANTVATLRAQRAPRALSTVAWHNALLVVFLGVVVAYGMHRISPRRPVRRLLLVLGGIVLWTGISYGAFVGAQIFVITAMPILSLVGLAVIDFGAGFLGDQLQKKNLRNTLARYVTSPIVQEIISASQQDDLQDLLAIREQDILGTVLSNRYRIIKVLGSGGFGETYLAEDIQRPGNPVCVVKHLKIVSDNPRAHQLARRLFTAEAATLQKLGEHDQIPRLLAYFEVNHSFYLVQELIEGPLLRDLLADCQPLSQRAVTHLLLDLLPVIQAVHDQGVIHRDIKPSNIIFREVDHHYVLIDFGAVKQISNQLTDTSARITSTVGIGTQGYMPSEQSAGLPNFSSDLYALGVTAIEALTGLPPHTWQRSNTGEILWTHKVDDLDPTLAEALTKMVRYDFNQRYNSAQQVLQALQTIPLSQLSNSVSIDPNRISQHRGQGVIEVDSSLDTTKLLPEDWDEPYRDDHHGA
jgi:CHASE2 domain-containing sensor protein